MLNTESVVHILEPLFHLAHSSLPLTLILKYSIHPLTDNDHFSASQSFFFFVSHQCFFIYALVRPLTQREWEDSLWCWFHLLVKINLFLCMNISDRQPCDGVKVEKRVACECHGCMFSDHACGTWVLM